MAEKTLPRFILRDCMLWADRESKLGQIGDITLPVPEAKREAMRNAGMIKERNVHLGYNALEMGFKMPGFDPQILKLFGLKPGVDTPFLITGALVDEDGTTHSAVVSIRGKMYKPDAGTWKGGDLAETTTPLTSITTSWKSTARKSTKSTTSISRWAASHNMRISATRCC
jgi:P2 family phage contractile tail tube protein